MAKDIGGNVSFWNSTWGAYGSMANDMASMRNRLVGVGFASAYDLNTLWDQAHRYRTGAGKCFCLNSAVLMSDLTWKMIFNVKEGDFVWSPNGPAKIKKVHRTLLGLRKMYEMKDGSLQWSSEHMIWVNRDNKPYFWSMSKEDLKFQILLMDSPILNDIEKVYEGEPYKEELFAHIVDTWKPNIPEKTHVCAPDFPLISPITENGEMFVVNGYLVDSSTDETKYDYTNINWENCLNDDIKNSIKTLPNTVADYIEYKTSSRYEEPEMPVSVHDDMLAYWATKSNKTTKEYLNNENSNLKKLQNLVGKDALL